MSTDETLAIENLIEFHVQDINGRADWPVLFGNSNPVEVEIGCGKGRFIITSAEAYPDINFLGIERALHYFRIIKSRSAKRQLTNIRLLQDDANYFVTYCIPDESVSAYHVYFPDPWPKKRHRKRRLIKPKFIECVERTLCAGGTLDVATDYEEYFEEMMGFLKASTVLIPMETLPERVMALGDGITNFEVKYVAQGRPIYRAAFRKEKEEGGRMKDEEIQN